MGRSIWLTVRHTLEIFKGRHGINAPAVVACTTSRAATTAWRECCAAGIAYVCVDGFVGRFYDRGFVATLFGILLAARRNERGVFIAQALPCCATAVCAASSLSQFLLEENTTTLGWLGGTLCRLVNRKAMLEKGGTRRYTAIEAMACV